MSAKTSTKTAEEVKAWITTHFVYVPMALICNTDLSDAERRVLMFLMAHDLPDHRAGGNKKGWVTVSRARICKFLGFSTERWVSRVLCSLEKKGFIRREERKGLVTLIRLKIPPICAVTRGEFDHGSPGEFDHGSPGESDHGSPGEFDHPEEQNRKRLSKKEREENHSLAKEWSPPIEDSLQSFRKPSRHKPLRVIRDPKKLERHLNAIDLEPFRQKYGSKIDVDVVFELFANRVVGSGNPRDYVDFEGAFDNWCLFNLR